MPSHSIGTLFFPSRGREHIGHLESGQQRAWGGGGGMGSPVQKGPIGLLDNVFLSLSNLVPLLCVWNGPGLLNLAQLFKAIIESLTTKQAGRRDQETKALCLCHHSGSRNQWKGGPRLTLKRSLIICRSLSRSWGSREQRKAAEKARLRAEQRCPLLPQPSPAALMASHISISHIQRDAVHSS